MKYKYILTHKEQHPEHPTLIFFTAGGIPGGLMVNKLADIPDEELIEILKSRIVPDKYIFDIAMWYEMDH